MKLLRNKLSEKKFELSFLSVREYATNQLNLIALLPHS